MYLASLNSINLARSEGSTDIRIFFSISSNFLLPARRQEIIKMTEQLIEAINTGDFEAYT